ncbi:hypothetical protein HLB35_00025 [Halomonas sp. TBZ9]|uniref:DUF4157 domain-containing protein n=1 Tax=Vreelandella azerica TaxID=2732867 RepID=A0A7Y3TVJ5_9GAMM|nr:hypothetical protein [Halomonas azerica]NOG30550.1 hypothetical protein [Halomonas azerica]
MPVEPVTTHPTIPKAAALSAAITQWVEKTNQAFAPHRRSCRKWKAPLAGYFSERFLSQCHYVIVPEIPLPDESLLQSVGIESAFFNHVAGLTLDNTYYLLPSVADALNVHFHELIHVAQWQHLGAVGFVSRYLHEWSAHEYHEMPLERMAYALEAAFLEGCSKIDVPEYVRQRLFSNA